MIKVSPNIKDIMTVDCRLIIRRIASNLGLFSGLIQTTLLLMKERFRSASLRFKIAFFVVLLLTSTSFVLCFLTVQIMNNYILSEIIKRGESVSKSIAAAAGYSLLSRDLLSLDNLVFKAKSSNNDMEYVAIVTPDTKAVAHSEGTMSGESLPVTQGRVIRNSIDGTTVKELSRSSDSIFEISCPVVFMKKNMGTVILAINKSVLLEAQGKVRTRILIMFGIIVILGTIASALLASFLIKPIKELSAGVDELKKGTSKTLLRIYSHDELGKLTSNFNEMSTTIADQQSRLNKYARDLEEAYVSIVKVVAAAIDARDSYTHGHSARVSQLSVLIGKAIGLSKEELEDIEVACLFHDVGKIKTPDSILLKPGKLAQSEYQEMIRHVEYGASILSKAPSLRKYIPAVRHHHERQDGKGYPDGLTSDAIPLFASIIAIADTFDAMTSTRPYRKAFSEETALQEIVRVAGTQLRADLVAVFVGLIVKSNIHDEAVAAGRVL
jgi:putative nucleotidyltransferase with HDIG domain